MARKTDSSDEKLDPSLIHKKKARRRLVGALAFLGSTAIALPFLLDAEPKPGTPQEVQIRVPAREPLTSGAPEAVSPQAGNGVVVVPPPVVMPPDSTSGKTESPKSDVLPRLDTPPKDEGKKDDAKKYGVAADEGKKPEVKKPEAKSDADKKEADKKEADKKDAAKKEAAKKDAAKKEAAKKDAAKKDDSKNDEAKAAKADDKKRDDHKAYSVQIGAFANEDAAKEQLAKAGKLGLKTYSEKVSTQSGSRYRARVGPFTSREQAEQALAKLKLNGIDAAVVAP